MAINHSSSHILATSMLENNPPAMPTTCASISKTRSGRKRPISPLPSTTTGQKRKNSNVDEEPEQAKKKKKTAMKMSKQGKGKASKRNGKETKPKKMYMFSVPLLQLLTTSFLVEKPPLCEPRRTPLQNGHLILPGEFLFCFFFIFHY